MVSNFYGLCHAFELLAILVPARPPNARISGVALPRPPACDCCMAIVHTIYQKHVPQESLLAFSIISGRASSDGDSRRWVTRTLSA